MAILKVLVVIVCFLGTLCAMSLFLFLMISGAEHEDNTDSDGYDDPLQDYYDNL